MATITFDENDVYTTTDGKFTMPLVNMPKATWIAAFTRAANHATGNEAIAIVSTYKTKNGLDTVDQDVADGLILDKRTKIFKDMELGLWATGTRGPRTASGDRMQDLRDSFAAADTRVAVSKKGWKAGETKDTWLVGDKIVELAKLVTIFLNDPAQGEARKASVEARAKAKYDAEMVEKARKAADREREAKAALEATDGELSL